MSDLFLADNPLAARQPKTDRLILARLVDQAALDTRLKDAATAVHPVLLRWADAETSGTLKVLSETKLQGDFLAEVFGQELGYRRAVEGQETWHLEQHHVINATTPDAALGLFGKGRDPDLRAVVELKGARVHLDRDRTKRRYEHFTLQSLRDFKVFRPDVAKDVAP